MRTDNISLKGLRITRPESYRHYAAWTFIWWFMISGGLGADWPVIFSIWTQSPYVVSYALTFYITLFWVAPALHENRVQFSVRKVAIIVGYSLMYMGLNRIIPEWENGSSVFHDYTIQSEIEESIVMLIYIWIPAYGLYYNKISVIKIKKVADEEVRLALDRERLVRNRLKLYKSEFNAHLTFNTLSLIYSRAIDNTEVSEPILLLSDILRYNTAIDADRVVPLTDEITHLRNFIRIHRIIYPDIAIEFRVEGETSHLTVLPRIFINYVENAIKYGAGDNCDSSVRIMLCTDEDGSIEFRVRNRKRSVYILKNSTGKGHYITTQTLEAFYGDRFSLDITEDDHWYEAYLRITPHTNELRLEPAT